MANTSDIGGEAMILGVSTKVFFGGLIGAAAGAVLGEGSWWERCIRGIVGAGFAYVGHSVTAKFIIGMLAGVLSWLIPREFLPTAKEVEPVAALLIGLVGMLFAQIAINWLTGVRIGAKEAGEEFIGEVGDGK